uniref:Protein kinase-like domain-containing protein n=1 Tax=Tanacetum cinerariifolium TaxID=118510 RepID=A0A699HWX2_TANCI|nr:protein kinase-like domain-containing protein [Tanacetum cinerariifolium]
MSNNKGEKSKKHSTPSSPKDNTQETLDDITPSVTVAATVAAPTFLSPLPPQQPPQPSSQLYLSTELVNPKRPRYTSTTGQWKLLPSPSQKQVVTPTTTEKILSPAVAAASSSDTASSPSHSPRLSVSGQETSKSEGEQQFSQHQLRKGKYVSPVWKPNEMLWLARAWRVQYQGSSGLGDRVSGSGSGSDRASDPTPINSAPAPIPSQLQGRGKTRAEKDKEVAEFLQRNGVNRDAKTAGTKWDNMLGEFRKVYEWERGGEREQIGKSYFRLSPYERKLHRLPASFDEEVFEELASFMGSRMRTPTNSIYRGTSPLFLTSGGDQDSRLALVETKSFPPPSFKNDDLPFSSSVGRSGRHMIMSGSGEGYFHGVRGSLLGVEGSPIDVTGGVGQYETSSSTTLKELRRIGKVRMVWEELVSLWAEDGEHHRGRIKVQGTSFLNADELTFLDDAMVACALEAFEDANSPLKGFSVDRFLPGQQVKVFGRRKSTHHPSTGLSTDRNQAPLEPPIRSIPPWEFQDPTEYYLGCLRVPPPSIPSLIDLPWYLQEPPPEELRFPLRKDLYRDLPPGKELFFTTSSEPLDCRSFGLDILSPIARSNPTLTITTRESFIGLWDDCINRVISKFSNIDMVFIRKPSLSNNGIQDQWPNVTGFVRNFCLWRGEETDRLREDNNLDPSSLMVQKLLWSYMDLPYILVDLSTPGDRIKALVPCWRIAGLLSLLADRCANVRQINKPLPYSDFERIDLGNNNIIELTPTYMTRVFSSKRKWVMVKEIYDFLDHRIPHSEFIFQSSENDLTLSFKPRGCKLKLSNFQQLVEALKHVTKALVALHDLSFMHRDLGWDKVMRRSDRENEWFIIGFDEAASAPQIYPPQHEVGVGVAPTSQISGTSAGGRHAPEMKGRGMHGVKVDVWGVGQMLKTCGLVGLPKALRELQNRCLDQNPEQRPTAADCYHHLLQLQSSMTSAAGDY